MLAASPHTAVVLQADGGTVLSLPALSTFALSTASIGSNARHRARTTQRWHGSAAPSDVRSHASISRLPCQSRSRSALGVSRPVLWPASSTKRHDPSRGAGRSTEWCFALAAAVLGASRPRTSKARIAAAHIRARRRHLPPASAARAPPLGAVAAAAPAAQCVLHRVQNTGVVAPSARPPAAQTFGGCRLCLAGRAVRSATPRGVGLGSHRTPG